jgi:hypothetical protein
MTLCLVSGQMTRSGGETGRGGLRRELGKWYREAHRGMTERGRRRVPGARLTGVTLFTSERGTQSTGPEQTSHVGCQAEVFSLACQAERQCSQCQSQSGRVLPLGCCQAQ